MKMEIQIEKLRNYSIFVGTPMYGGDCKGAYCMGTNDLAELCGKYGIPIKFHYLFNESLIQRARNYVVDEFLRSDATHLMFIDADIGFNAKDVIGLLHLQVNYPDQYDILTGPYTKKTILWDKIIEAVKANVIQKPSDLAYFAGDFAINLKKGTTEIRLDAPIEVQESGTGFMLIPRSVFEKYEVAFPEKKYKPDHIRTQNFNGDREVTAYFDCIIDPETKRYLSEDYYFCQNAQKIGIKLHMCPWINLSHIGTNIFRGSLNALAVLEDANKTLTNQPKSNKIPNKSKSKRR